MNGPQLMFVADGSTRVRINEKYQECYPDSVGVFYLVGYSVQHYIRDGLCKTAWHGIISRERENKKSIAVRAERLDLVDPETRKERTI